MAGKMKVLLVATCAAVALLAGLRQRTFGGARQAGCGLADGDCGPGASGEAPKVDHRKDPVKLVDGKPVWAASRRYSAEESAQHAFDRNGETLGAETLEDCVGKAHAFVEHPPKGAETLTRANGDTLFYDAKTNVFVVADKAGAPRTMFKPDDGAAYWQEQKDREAKRQTAKAEKRSHQDDDA